MTRQRRTLKKLESTKNISADIKEVINKILFLNLDKYSRSRILKILAELYLKYDGDSKGISGTTIEELKQKIKLLEKESKKADIDGPTGLLKKEPFLKLFEKKLANERGGLYALIVADLRKFKHINDTLGHLAGDMVIKETANLLKKNIRRAEGDLLCRYGGDEFVIFLDEIQNEINTAEILQRFRDIYKSHAWDRKLKIKKGTVDIGINFGALIFEFNAIGYQHCPKNVSGFAKKIIRIADKLMYNAKNSDCEISIGYLRGKCQPKQVLIQNNRLS